MWHVVPSGVCVCVWLTMSPQGRHVCHRHENSTPQQHPICLVWVFQRKHTHFTGHCGPDSWGGGGDFAESSAQLFIWMSISPLNYSPPLPSSFLYSTWKVGGGRYLSHTIVCIASGHSTVPGRGWVLATNPQLAVYTVHPELAKQCVTLKVDVWSCFLYMEPIGTFEVICSGLL